MSISGIGMLCLIHSFIHFLLHFSYRPFSIKTPGTNITSVNSAEQLRWLLTPPYFTMMLAEAIEKITFLCSNFGDAFDTQLMLAVDSMQSFGKNEAISIERSVLILLCIHDWYIKHCEMLRSISLFSLCTHIHTHISTHLYLSEK